MKHKRWIICSAVLAAAILSCSLWTTPTQAPVPDQPTTNAQPDAVRTHAVPPAQPTHQAAPTQTTQANIPPPASSTKQKPGPPTISASVDTNCRTGPSTLYDAISYLLVGITSEVTAKYQGGSYWVIKDPNNPNRKCWVWGQTTTVTGNWQQLPEATAPPLPTTGQSITVTSPTNTTGGPAITVSGSMANYSGACPVTKSFNWSVTSNQQVAVTYTTQVSGYPVGAPKNTTLQIGMTVISDPVNISYNMSGSYWVRFIISTPVYVNQQVNFSINCQ